MLKILTPPTTTPYSLDNVKQYLRVLDNHQDYQINLMAQSYLLKAEEITNLVLQGITEFEWSVDGGFRDLVLPRNPVTEIVKIEYVDNSDVTKDFSLNNVEYSFALGVTKTPFNLHFMGDTPFAKKLIITFKAGFATIDPRVEMFLNAKVGEEYDGLSDAERSIYTDRMLDSLRVNHL